MSDPSATEMQAAPAPAWPMVRALVGVGLMCGLLIVLVFEGTKPIIRQNQIEARERAIFQVLQGAETTGTFRATDSGFEPGSASDEGSGLLFAGYDASGRLIGLAIEAAGMGYQDTVRLLYGYAPDKQAIVGIQVLESRETPGLGTRIETDAAFLQNFEALDVSLAADGSGLKNAIVPVKPGEKTGSWQVECITGATVSSVAVAEILDKSATQWMPRLAGQAAAFQRVED